MGARSVGPHLKTLIKTLKTPKNDSTCDLVLTPGRETFIRFQPFISLMVTLLITGGRKHIADVKAFLRALVAIGEDYGVTVQAVNADAIAGRMHLEFATGKAIEAFRQKRNLARDLGIEIMLYLRGRRQIERALDLGVRQGDNNVAVVLVGDNTEKALPAVRSLLDMVDDTVVDYSHEKDLLLMKLFEITPAEIGIVGRDRIPELVRERSALLEFEK